MVVRRRGPEGRESACIGRGQKTIEPFRKTFFQGCRSRFETQGHAAFFFCRTLPFFFIFAENFLPFFFPPPEQVILSHRCCSYISFATGPKVQRRTLLCEECYWFSPKRRECRSLLYLMRGQIGPCRTWIWWSPLICSFVLLMRGRSSYFFRRSALRTVCAGLNLYNAPSVRFPSQPHLRPQLLLSSQPSAAITLAPPHTAAAEHKVRLERTTHHRRYSQNMVRIGGGRPNGAAAKILAVLGAAASGNTRSAAATTVATNCPPMDLVNHNITDYIRWSTMSDRL